MKRVLMIAQVFAPVNRAGTARPFYFAKHLSEFGYHPTVIAAQPEEGSPVDDGLLPQLKTRARVIHISELSLRGIAACVSKLHGRKLGSSSGSTTTTKANRKQASLFERAESIARRHWSSGCWTLPVLAASLRIRFRSNFDLIWATGDPWNSLMAGWWLSRLTKKPLVADFRDPWTYGVLWSPRDDEEALWNEQWERRVVTQAKRTVFTSPLTTDIMARKYGSITSNSFVTIPNGFDEDSPSMQRGESNGKCTFRFVGTCGGRYRDPTILFKAISMAKANPQFAEDAVFQFIGRMNGCDKEIQRFGLAEIVQYLGFVSHKESREYMCDADVLVLIQTIDGIGADCISGKVFEYLRSRRPILAIVPEYGGDAWLVQSTCSGVVTGIKDPGRIATEIVNSWKRWKTNGHIDARRSKGIEQYSRRNTTKQLAKLFDEVLGDRRDEDVAPSDG